MPHPPPALRSLSLAALAALAAACGDPRPVAERRVAGCTTCHGSGDDPAPPSGLRGETSTSEAAVGAHRLHLRDTPIRGALPCSECHVVPATVAAPGHLGAPLLAWGTLATSRGSTPSFDAAALTCAGVYCHGGNPALRGGTRTAPTWTYASEPDLSGPPEQVCTTCHGWPPPPPHPQNPDCRRCHGTTVGPGGTIDVAGGKHVNGRFDFAGTDGTLGCTSCHGSGDDPAPPIGLGGETSTAQRAVGAHRLHLRDTPIRAALPCSECHVVPATVDAPGHFEPPLLTWGPLATARGAQPALDPAQVRCSGVYCHGTTLAGGTATSPVWTYAQEPDYGLPPQQVCTACHGWPPPPPHPQLASCAGCHGTTVRADGAIDVAGGRHVNGAIDLGGAGGGGLLCASCHGYPPATGAHLVHFGWTAGADRATYGETAILEDYAALGAPTGSFYAFGCGNCHPVDPARHMDGALQVELAGTGLPPETLKSRNPPEAAFSRPAGTCASVYCHSSGQQASAAAGTPVYATTPGWGSGEKLGCGSCHGNPPRYPSGGPGAVTANSHIGLAFDGYSFGHFGGLPGIWHPGPTFGSKHGGGNFPASPPEGASPITCQTCHHATVDPANAGPSGFYYLDTSGDYSVPGAVAQYDCLACHVAGSPVAPTGAGRVLPLRHVNGSRDVVFDPRPALPSISWLPVAPFTPTRPTWVTDAAPLVTALPAGAVYDPAALPSPNPGPYTKPTLSLSLSNAGWAPALKTCSNVGCHLAQTAVQWGGVPLNARDPCAACHGL